MLNIVQRDESFPFQFATEFFAIKKITDILQNQQVTVNCSLSAVECVCAMLVKLRNRKYARHSPSMQFVVVKPVDRIISSSPLLPLCKLLAACLNKTTNLEAPCIRFATLASSCPIFSTYSTAIQVELNWKLIRFVHPVYLETISCIAFHRLTVKGMMPGMYEHIFRCSTAFFVSLDS